MTIIHPTGYGTHASLNYLNANTVATTFGVPEDLIELILIEEAKTSPDVLGVRSDFGECDRCPACPYAMSCLSGSLPKVYKKNTHGKLSLPCIGSVDEVPMAKIWEELHPPVSSDPYPLVETPTFSPAPVWIDENSSGRFTLTNPTDTTNNGGIFTIQNDRNVTSGAISYHAPRSYSYSTRIKIR